MARNESPPFARGETWYGQTGTIDSTDLGADNILGKEWVFEDVDPTDGTARTGRYVRCRAVRNTSGVALLPKYLVQLDTTNAGELPHNATGYVNTTAGHGYPVDEYLPAAGVRDDDIFWVVIEGPAVVVTSTNADAGNVVALGDFVIGETAAASTHSTTAGRVEVGATTAATQPLYNMIVNRVGRAMSAKTTGESDEDLLIDVGHI